MGKRRCARKKFIPILSVLVALLRQLALVPCVAPASEPHRILNAATRMSFYLYELTAAGQHTRRTCNATIGECDAEEEEMMMESEISKRFLAEQPKRVIGYPPIKVGNKAACANKNGNTYGTCGALPPPSNPPRRGCNGYYRCRTNN